MTLIVGRRNLNGVIGVVGDMRLTDSAELRRGYPYAALKNIILSPHHLVGYAGNADLGMHTIRRLKDASVDELAEGLFVSAQEASSGPGAVGYLLAHAEQGVQRITGTGAEADLSDALEAFGDSIGAEEETLYSLSCGDGAKERTEMLDEMNRWVKRRI
jgi:hypothetical protein